MTAFNDKVCFCEVHRSQKEISPLACIGHGDGCPCTAELEKEKKDEKLAKDLT